MTALWYYVSIWSFISFIILTFYLLLFFNKGNITLSDIIIAIICLPMSLFAGFIYLNMEIIDHLNQIVIFKNKK